MASIGTRGPKPWTQHRASTIFLRVPTADWIAVRHGKTREFRAESGKVSQLWHVSCPVPVVAYRLDSRRPLLLGADGLGGCLAGAAGGDQC
jgi:hypothetical protein